MMHIDEGALLAYLDDEGSEVQHRRVAEHLAACASCAGEYRRLRDRSADVRGLVFSIDVPPPVERAWARLEELRGEPARGGSATKVTPLRPRKTGNRSFRIGLLQAAVLALVLAGVAGAAIPGSPLRAWVASAFDAAFGRDDAAVVPEPAPEPPVAQPEPTVAPAPRLADESEMEAAPAGGQVRVVLRSPPAATRVVVELTDDASASVRAVASMRVASGRLEAFDITSSTVVVRLPRGAASASVEADGRVLLRAENGAFVQLPSDATVTGDEVRLRIGR